MKYPVRAVLIVSALIIAVSIAWLALKRFVLQGGPSAGQDFADDVIGFVVIVFCVTMPSIGVAGLLYWLRHNQPRG